MFSRRKSDNRIVFDLGAHQGEDAFFYLKKGFNVVAVEPNPDLASQIEHKLSDWITRGRLVVIRSAIGSHAGPTSLFINRTWDSWSSLSPEIGGRGEAGAREIKVSMVRLEDLIERYGAPYYLKVDIEGMDHLALRSLKYVNNLPRYVSVENGHAPLLRLLDELGYDRFKWVNQAEVAKQRLPFPSREGRFCMHSFQYGSSGAFGDEAPGAWVSLDEVVERIEAYWALESHAREERGWYDLHARHGDGVATGE